MYNLFNLTSFACNGFLDIFLDILAVFSIILGISVILSKNPVVSVLFLIGLFLSISLNLILLGYNFIGLSYLLVYVGAVSILFLFILMLINIRVSELVNDTSNSIPLAVFTGFSFGLPLYLMFDSIDSIKDKYINLDLPFWLKTEKIDSSVLIDKTGKTILDKFSGAASCVAKQENILVDPQINTYINEDISTSILNNNSLEIYYVTSKSWDNSLVEISDISSVGNILYSTYGIWLIICSIILLLAMIGAITITKKEKY
jgi:NADH-ubiquinone oxidoreductase chain 6